MRKTKLLSFLALLLMAVTGAKAQNGWDAVYAQTQTTSPDWTPLTSGSATGKVLGASGTTSYYYLTKSLSFSNDYPGGSGLTIKGTVYLYFPAGVTMTCYGADADGKTGAGAGIELSAGNTLYIIGCGTLGIDGKTFSPANVVTATGGNAANGGNGGRGGDATVSYSSPEGVYAGTGGNGGYGGGGAGAGIGTRGGDGGAGGAGGYLGFVGYSYEENCVEGKPGGDGSGADAMGSLYVDQTFGIRVKATGGSKASSNGSGGSAGSCNMLDDFSNQSVAGGGGGGAGGYGGAASDIGTGGPGGGAGGGGSSGSVRRKANPGYYRVGSAGGHGGQNADGDRAANGSGTLMSGTQYFNNDSFEDYGEDGGTGIPAMEVRGFKGNDSSTGSMNTGKLEYNITYNPVITRVNGVNTDAVVQNYSPSSATTVILPKNIDGYQWVLYVYGKNCSSDGSAVSDFTKPVKTFFGGNYNDESLRTVLLNDVYGDIVFQEVASVCKIADDGNNQQTLEEFYYDEDVASQKYPITVRLMDHTLYRDNHWNTICLPFSMTPSQINNSPLKGAQIWKMNQDYSGYYSTGYKNESLNINVTYPFVLFYFEDAQPETNGLKAGKPYLVKWAEPDDMTEDGNLVDNTNDGNSRHELDFNNVTVTATTAGSWLGQDGVAFQGTFSISATLKAHDMTKLVLGADDKLYTPSKNMSVGSCRGYFIIPQDAAIKARQFVMSFDNGETTGIQTLNVDSENLDNATVYNLNGQRLIAPQKGINIINGKKVFIK